MAHVREVWILSLRFDSRSHAISQAEAAQPYTEANLYSGANFMFLLVDAELPGRICVCFNHSAGGAQMKDRIVQLVMQGCGNPQIAERLNIHKEDLERELSEILADLQLRNQVELILYAYSSAGGERQALVNALRKKKAS